MLAVKLQELLGWRDRPRVLERREAVCLHLLSPAGRQLQVICDLRWSWQGSYQQVRQGMRGCYPKDP